MKLCLTKNQQKNCTNQLLKKFEKQKVQSPFVDNIWGSDLLDIQSLSKFNKGIHFLLRVSDIYNKYAWAFPFNKGTPITNSFSEILDESNRKPSKICIDTGS